MEKIGIVTVTYNSAEVIQPFLENLFAQTFTNFNLYVIDNNSKDATLKILDIIDDSNFFLVKNNKNLGVAAANNIGIKKLKVWGKKPVMLRFKKVFASMSKKANITKILPKGKKVLILSFVGFK